MVQSCDGLEFVQFFGPPNTMMYLFLPQRMDPSEASEL